MKLKSSAALLVGTLFLGTALGGEVNFSVKRAVELNEDFTNLSEVKEKINTFIVSAKFEREFEKDGYLKCSGKSSSKVAAFAAFKKDVELEMVIKESEPKLSVNCEIVSANQKVADAKLSFYKSLFISDEVLYQDLVLPVEKGNMMIDRLIMTKSGLLLTNGEKVSLKAREIYSEDGTIMTFDEGMRKALNQFNRDGLSGGEISIKANKSFGKLNVVMAGKDGDDQLSKALEPINDFSYVDHSRDGVDELLGPCTRNNRISIKRNSSGDLCRDWNPREPIACKKPAEAGPNGQDGEAGMDGNNGGDSGRMIYVTDEAEATFEIAFTAIVGNGGKGALGAPGSLGGKGGEGSRFCSKGKDGKDGQRGKDGMNGVKGKAQASCFQNIQKGINTCK